MFFQEITKTTMQNNMLIDNQVLKNTKRLLIYSVAFFALIQCVPEDKTSYKKSSSGVYYTVHEKASDTARKPEIGDVLILDLLYKTVDDSLLFHSNEMPGKFRIQLEPAKDSSVSSIESALMLMSVGDSMSFYLDAVNFYQNSKHIPLPDFLQAGDSLLFSVALKGVEKPEVLENEKESLHQRLQFAEDEMIAEYVQNHFEGIDPTVSGMYIKVFKEGTGTLPQPGNIVGLDYTMSYLNGEVFYSTLKQPKPFEFKMGEGMVISGLEEGIAQLKRGSHALLLIPSHLAYGAEGYKIIQPFTPLVFEVKVLQPE